MVPKLTRLYAAQVIDRLRTLSPDAQPVWGRMQGADVVPHLVTTFKFSMGRLPVGIPFQGNWKSRTYMRWALLAGLARIPRNVRFRDATGKRAEPTGEGGTIEELQALIEEFITGVERGGMSTVLHPFLGDLGPSGWSRFHVAHLRHHLEQFGLNAG